MFGLDDGLRESCGVGPRLGEQDRAARGPAGHPLLRFVAVRVPDDHDVDAGHLFRDLPGRVLRGCVGVRGVGGLPDPRVAQDDDHVGQELLAQFRHPVGCGGDHVGDVHLPCELLAVPDHRARCGQAEHPDPDLPPVEPADQGREGREHRQPRAGIDDVGSEQQRVELLLEGVEEIEAVVELVVSDVDRVVAHDVERRRKRVNQVPGPGFVPGEEGAQGISLDGVAVVHQHHALRPTLGSDAFDDGGQLGQPGFRLTGPGLVAIVVPVQGGAVDVRGGQQRESRHLGSFIQGRSEPIASVG